MIYIPIAEQEKELKTVQESIKSLKKFGYDYEFVSSPDYAKKGLEHQRQIKETRNKLFKIALKNKEKYICSQESSVVHLVDDNIEVMEKYLDDNPKCGGVFINKCKRPLVDAHLLPHMWRAVSLYMVRSELVEGFEFDIDDYRCECQQLPECIRSQKYEEDQYYTADWLEAEPGRILKP